MDYQLPADLSAEVQQRLSLGVYRSADEVLRAAFSALRAQDEEVAAIQAGIDDMNAGRVRSLEECERDFRERRNIPADQ